MLAVFPYVLSIPASEESRLVQHLAGCDRAGVRLRLGEHLPTRPATGWLIGAGFMTRSTETNGTIVT